MTQDSHVEPTAGAAAAPDITTEPKELQLPIRQSSFGTAAPGQTLTGKQEHCALLLFTGAAPYDPTLRLKTDLEIPRLKARAHLQAGEMGDQRTQLPYRPAAIWRPLSL
jgi:hypothetical protein